MSEGHSDDALDEAGREQEILDAWALRFDGYAYEAATGFVLADGSTAYVDHGRVPEDPLARLAVLFAMQRWLGKWGGEQLPQDGAAWQAFRRLFLLTVDVEVPERYRMSGWFEPWERTMLPHKPAWVALVEKRYNAGG